MVDFMQSQEQIASASYIMTFFNDVEALSWQSANYVNLMISTKAKYSTKDLKDDTIELDSEDQSSLVNITQNLRAMIFRTYTKLIALSDSIHLEKELEGEIKKLYEKIIKEVSPSQVDVETFNIKINKVFVSGVMADLLLKSKDIISGLVS